MRDITGILVLLGIVVFSCIFMRSPDGINIKLRITRPSARMSPEILNTWLICLTIRGGGGCGTQRAKGSRHIAAPLLAQTCRCFR